MKSKIQSLIKEYFETKEASTPPTILPGTPISDELRYHIDNGIPLNECVFRYGSDQYNAVIQEAKDLLSVNLISLNETDRFIAEDHEVESALFEGYEVVCGIIQEDIVEEELNEADKFKGKKSGTPTRDSSGGKVYKIHVPGCAAKTETNPRGIKVVRFGSGGLKAKINDPDARKRYDNRHGCSAGKHNDKCKAGYYSCRLPRYASALGLSGGGKWW
jgi:hypothetical protein